MDYRAIHLQPAAHAAVANALRTGKLVRLPCEVCGEHAQAHHDSYFPKRWLEVRWLCGKHHRAWHDGNEPEWPTIFDYHPSDAMSGPSTGRPGRPPRPWWRSNRNSWYVCLGGRHIRLHPDREVAEAMFQKLFAEHLARIESSGAASGAAA
jgi:hypothetical protein